MALALINNCLVSIVKDPAVSLFSTTTDCGSDRDSLGACTCGRHIIPSPLAGLLRSRLSTLDRVVADLPLELGPHKPLGPSLDQARSLQYETMRLNLHITYRWVQSLLIERLISLSGIGSEDRADLWDMLQNVCAELLMFVKQMTQEVMVLHGTSLVRLKSSTTMLTLLTSLQSYKIRQTAASLLDHPFLPGSAASNRAQEQIKAFADILASLDAIHAKSWNHLLLFETRASDHRYWRVTTVRLYPTSRIPKHWLLLTNAQSARPICLYCIAWLWYWFWTLGFLGLVSKMSERSLRAVYYLRLGPRIHFRWLASQYQRSVSLEKCPVPRGALMKEPVQSVHIQCLTRVPRLESIDDSYPEH